MTDYNTCEHEGCDKKITTFYSFTSGYKHFCCNSHAAGDKKTLDKKHKTKEEKYGDPNYFNLEKYIQTCNEKYGCDYASQSPIVRQHIEEAFLSAYGATSFMATDQFRQMSMQHFNENFGVDYPMQVPDIMQLAEQTKEKRYGDKHYNNMPKQRQTMLDNYGVESNFQLSSHIQYMKDNKDEINAKKRATLLDNFGMTHVPTFKYEYDRKLFDSKPELAYYIWLKDNGIQFNYQPNVDIMYEYDGKMHRYMPDFIVEGQYVEIKGDHFFKEDGTMQCPFDHSQDSLYEAKHQCMLANNVKILKSDEYLQFIDYVETKYGKQYLLSFKQSK